MRKYRLGKNSRKNMEGIREELSLLAHRVIAKSKNDFGIPKFGGKRSVEDQQYLYSIGRKIEKHRKPITKVDGIKKESYHQSGNALDIFLYHSHKEGGRQRACWSCTELYGEIANLFKHEFELMKDEGLFSKDEVIEWGGDWRWKDYPHFQIVNIEKDDE